MCLSESDSLLYSLGVILENDLSVKDDSWIAPDSYIQEDHDDDAEVQQGMLVQQGI